MQKKLRWIFHGKLSWNHLDFLHDDQWEKHWFQYPAILQQEISSSDSVILKP